MSEQRLLGNCDEILGAEVESFGCRDRADCGLEDSGTTEIQESPNLGGLLEGLMGWEVDGPRRSLPCMTRLVWAPGWRGGHRLDVGLLLYVRRVLRATQGKTEMGEGVT